MFVKKIYLILLEISQCVIDSNLFSYFLIKIMKRFIIMLINLYDLIQIQKNIFILVLFDVILIYYSSIEKMKKR